RALCLLEYGTDQMINGRLFPNVASLCTTSRQGYLGHARPPIYRRFWLRPLTGGRQLRQTGAGGKAHLTAKKRRQTRGSVYKPIHFEHHRLLASGYVRSCPSIA